MRVKNELLRFLRNGTSVFREASKGRYNYESEAVSNLKKEVFKEKERIDDKINLLNDRKKIEGDIRKAFNEIVLNNG